MVDGAGGTLALGTAGVRRATLTSTGLNSTAIGATTPSTVAATTVSASGAITSTLTSGNYLNAASATTSPVYLRQTNTSGQTTLGTEGSTAAQLLTGSTAYGSVLGYQVGKTLSIGSSATVAQISDTGLAVTGGISSTSTNTYSGGWSQFSGTGGAPSSGSGYEIRGGTTPAITAYNRTGGAYLGCSLDGLTVNILASGTGVLLVSSGSVAVTGAITATGNITAYYSDDRLKNKLGNIENALDKVCSLDGFYYEANETAQALGYKPVREVGLSAQSVQKVLPEVIAPAPIDSQYLTMHYERVVPLLVEAIKELRAEVASLKKCNC